MADLSNIGLVSFYRSIPLTIKGVVVKNDLPVSKKIHVIDVVTGKLLAETYSKEDGVFEIEGIPLNAEIDVIVHY